jgi:hypothetical protein
MELSGEQHILYSIYTSHPAIASQCTAGSYSGGVMVAGHYHTCCCYRSLNMYPAVTIV